ncbi:MAG: FeoA family protein [Eubacterium sp.]
MIHKITGKDEVRQHLTELGFVVGSSVTIISEIGGNMILSVKESRIALDKTMANRIMI